MAEKAILYDSTKCTACRGCQVACKQWWNLEAETTTNRGSYENPPDLSPSTFTRVLFKEEVPEIFSEKPMPWFSAISLFDGKVVREKPIRKGAAYDTGRQGRAGMVSA